MSGWIDVSVTLQNGMVGWPGDRPFELRRVSDMGCGEEMNLSQLSTSAHIGTHMDAPLHFVDGAMSIDQVPLDVVLGPARVIGIDREITTGELERANIQPGERILFRTPNSRRDWPNEPFREDFIAIREDAARWLAARKPALAGIDYLSIAPFADPGPTHRVLLSAGIWVLEGLYLANVEPGDYDLACLPLKLAGADGAPARVALRRRTT